MSAVWSTVPPGLQNRNEGVELGQWRSWVDNIVSVVDGWTEACCTKRDIPLFYSHCQTRMGSGQDGLLYFFLSWAIDKKDVVGHAWEDSSDCAV